MNSLFLKLKVSGICRWGTCRTVQAWCRTCETARCMEHPRRFKPQYIRLIKSMDHPPHSRASKARSGRMEPLMSNRTSECGARVSHFLTVSWAIKRFAKVLVLAQCANPRTLGVPFKHDVAVMCVEWFFCKGIFFYFLRLLLYIHNGFLMWAGYHVDNFGFRTLCLGVRLWIC